MTNPNDAAAQSIQEKLELYLLGLAFTLLGLSIQTARFEGPPPQRIAELIGWLLFLVSGVVGLRRLQWAPVYLRYGTAKQQIESQISQAGAHPGQVINTDKGLIPVERFIADREAEVERLDVKDVEINRKLHRMGNVQTWCFVFGVVAVAVSRAYVPNCGETLTGQVNNCGFARNDCHRIGARRGPLAENGRSSRI